MKSGTEKKVLYQLPIKIDKKVIIYSGLLKGLTGILNKFKGKKWFSI